MNVSYCGSSSQKCDLKHLVLSVIAHRLNKIVFQSVNAVGH
jgi:hypothetical protein